ncbi:MAG: O-antigen ligase family protein, partial [Candidatus Nitrotoga sp.]
RYGPQHEALLTLHVLDWSVALSLTGWLVWRWRIKRDIACGNWLMLIMLAFVGWLFLCALFALRSGTPWQPLTERNPTLFLHALTLACIAAGVLRWRSASWQLPLLVALAVIINALLQGKGVYLENDIAFLSVVALPLVAVGIWIAPNWPIRIGQFFATAGLLYVMLMTQNRAAAVGAVAAVFVTWWHLSQKWRVLAFGLPVLIVTLALVTPLSYLDRFQVLWDVDAHHETASLDRETIEERLLLWNAGWQMTKDKPWVGVGIGNYPNVVGFYLPQMYQGMVTHNGFLQIAAETGFPGLILYCALFLGALAMLQRTIRLAKEPWRRSTGIAIQAALAAYLVTGVFLSRHDFVFSYILVGWSVALCVSRVSKKFTTRS